MGLDTERKMALKIAVCWSGQLRLNYHTNILRMKKFLPDADFYFTTWDNQPNETFLNRKYIEPRAHYNPSIDAIKQNIKILRKIKNGEIKEEDLPQRITNMGGISTLTEQAKTSVSNRIKSRNHTKQHIAHAMTVKDFVSGKGYDIVIRARYDVFIRAEMKSHLMDFCQWVYDYKQPMGFHSYNKSKTLEEAIKATPKIQNLFASSLHDFLIIHREDMFDPIRTLYLYEKKMLGAAEHGWWQIMCEPYSVHGIDCTGFAKIGQQHIDQMNWFHNNYHLDPFNVKYDFLESLIETNNDTNYLAK